MPVARRDGRARKDIHREQMTDGIPEVSGLVVRTLTARLRIGRPDHDHLQARLASSTDLPRAIGQDPCGSLSVSQLRPSLHAMAVLAESTIRGRVLEMNHRIRSTADGGADPRFTVPRFRRQVTPGDLLTDENDRTPDPADSPQRDRRLVDGGGLIGALNDQRIK